MQNENSMLGLFQKLFFNFNARQMKDATLAFKKHLDDGGKMLVAMGGAMSSAQMGITLAPMIKTGLPCLVRICFTSHLLWRKFWLDLF